MSEFIKGPIQSVRLRYRRALPLACVNGWLRTPSLKFPIRPPSLRGRTDCISNRAR